MSVTEYTPVTFSPGDPLVVEKMNALANNVELLNQRTPTILYAANGITKDKGLKVYTTTVVVPPNSKSGSATARVYFGNFFSTACKPIVTATVNSYPQGRYHTTVCGHGPVIPDSRGVAVLVAADELNPKNNKISKTIYVDIIAVGW